MSRREPPPIAGLFVPVTEESMAGIGSLVLAKLAEDCLSVVLECMLLRELCPPEERDTLVDESKLDSAILLAWAALEYARRVGNDVELQA